MGAQLVSLVLVRWAPHISDRAFRVLVRMAHTALDADVKGRSAGMYYGGRDLLAMTLRAERGGTDEAAHRTVRRAISELLEVGAIERITAAKRGTTGAYRLRLEAPVKAPVPRSLETAVPVSRDRNKTDSGLQGSELRTPADPLRNQEEPSNPKEPTEEIALDLDTALTVARANETGKGNGFCLVCYERGEFTLALDEISGTECRNHLNVVPIRRKAS